MIEDRYQGWTNFATWSIMAVLDNSQTWQDFCLALAGEAEARADECVRERQAVIWSRYDDTRDHFCTAKERRNYCTAVMSDSLRSYFLDNQPGFIGDVWSTLIQGAIETVNWREIAAHYIEMRSESLAHTTQGT